MAESVTFPSWKKTTHSHTKPHYVELSNGLSGGPEIFHLMVDTNI